MCAVVLDPANGYGASAMQVIQFAVACKAGVILTACVCVFLGKCDQTALDLEKVVTLSVAQVISLAGYYLVTPLLGADQAATVRAYEKGVILEHWNVTTRPFVLGQGGKGGGGGGQMGDEFDKGHVYHKVYHGISNTQNAWP